MANYYIAYHADSVHVNDSWCIVHPSMIVDVCKIIKRHVDCPVCLNERSPRGLAREWMAHNALYFVGIEEARTGSVDLDDEPWWRKCGYWCLAMVYRVAWPALFLINQKRG